MASPGRSDWVIQIISLWANIGMIFIFTVCSHANTLNVLLEIGYSLLIISKIINIRAVDLLRIQQSILVVYIIEQYTIKSFMGSFWFFMGWGWPILSTINSHNTPSKVSPLHKCFTGICVILESVKKRPLIASPYLEGILPKEPYPPCLRMADRVLLAGYPRTWPCPNKTSPNTHSLLIT